MRPTVANVPNSVSEPFLVMAILIAGRIFSRSYTQKPGVQGSAVGMAAIGERSVIQQ
jgi:hypothetical protein